MTAIQSASASPFDSIQLPGEVWSARALMKPLGYPRWNEFESVIERAQASAANQGFAIADLFRVTTEKSGGRPRSDYHLTRFACYLVAMNGDPRKPEVAAAQSYFAIKTREAETAIAPALTGPALMAAALVEAQAVLAAKDQQIAVLEPKANYVDVFVTDSDLLSIRTVASTLGVQEGWLRNQLVDRRWIYAEHSSRWSGSKGLKVNVTRYSEYADKKAYFQRVQNHDAPRFRGEVMHTLKVTAAGANAISRMVSRWQAGAA